MSSEQSSPRPDDITIARRSALTIEFKLRRPVAVPTKAVLMIKNNLSDNDASSLVAKVIYPAASASGVIDNSNPQKPVLRFQVSELDTQELPLNARLYTALKVWPTGGAPYSPPQGRKGVRIVEEGVFETA